MSKDIAGVWVKAETMPRVIGEYFCIVKYPAKKQTEKMVCEFNYDVWCKGEENYEVIEYLDESQPIPLPDVEDLQEQVRKHISAHNLFNWDEALTGEEMTYLENLLLTFAPIFQPGSIGFEKAVKPFLVSQPIPVNQDGYWKKRCEAAELYISYVRIEDSSDPAEKIAYKLWQQLKSNPEPIPVQEGLDYELAKEAIDIIEGLVYFSQIHEVKGVVLPKGSHEDFWKRGQQFLWNKCKIIEGEYFPSPVHPEKKEK